MPGSHGEKPEKTQPNQANTKAAATEQGKRKRNRNRNRKKNPTKVENLVSKTFQAKLVATSSQFERSHENDSLKSNISSTIEEKLDKHVCETFLKNNRTELATINNSKIHPATSTKQRSELEKIEKKSTVNMVQPVVAVGTASEKSREEILAEREAKKLAKQQAKKKNKDSGGTQENSINNNVTDVKSEHLPKGKFSEKDEKSKEKEFEKRIEKQVSNSVKPTILPEEKSTSQADDPKLKDKKNPLTKAERRAIQEAQRAAKSEAIGKEKKQKDLRARDKKVSSLPINLITANTEKATLTKSVKDCKVKLFNHLESCRQDSNLFVNNPHIHPIIVRLGEQYSKRTIVGSNARCISFLSALKTVIQDYETPPKKEFARSLETTIKNSVDHLHKCRPLAVSVCNAYKHIKHVLTQLPVDQAESELKERLCHFVDTYIENQIGKAAQAISSSVQEKISNGDVILTFGCSSLINYIFEEAHRRHVDFRVIVVDSRPFSEGQELLRRLTVKEIPCTYVLINAVGFVMPDVTKILLGAHALLSNGYVMARTGTAQVALVARSFNVPVLVCCETHKFSERFQTDAIVYNELGNPNDLIISDKCRLVNWQIQNKLSPLNLNYDITPPELVTAVVTEVAILPCTSVPVILRIKPTEIGY